MTYDTTATSPAPDPFRRGGIGPEGQADRTDLGEDASRCDGCGFLVAEETPGLACKSGKSCPFHGKTIKYLAPPAF